MFTTENYFTIAHNFDFSNMPEAIRNGHEFVVDVTENGVTWQDYNESDTIRETIDTYFTTLHRYLEKNGPKADKKNSTGVKSKPGKTASVQPNRVPGKVNKNPLPSTDIPVLVSKIPEELRFIRRFINIDGKTQTRDDLLRFINALQKAIVEKRIRKVSPWAKEISTIQDKLISLYNGMKNKVTIVLRPETREALKKYIAGEKVLPSVSFIKRYIGMHEKPAMKEKAKKLLSNIDTAAEKGKIIDHDPYAKELLEIKRNLQDFISDRGMKTLKIEPAVLNGLQGIMLDGCGCKGGLALDGIGNDSPVIMNSLDFAKLDFKTIGFSGEWREFIGDPAPGFTVMIFGRPKMGKSILALDFAGYLAAQHGPTLYVCKEEGLNKTFQDKVLAVKHHNLHVSPFLPDDLSPYQYIFLDSVTRLGLTPEDLRRLKARYPGKSFIYIFQVTKHGIFKGNNDFQHDVDIVIEVPQKGKAVQMGRYNQGGEMDIFKRA
jgi:hypothetical protein